jgi:glycosyltransferase involved in cell wall biosynthesis
MSKKISVVVPTYAPGERINALVHSLEQQSMPASEFEVIFVDDGSPDDTWDRLERIRDSHANVRIERIENSGWPSRPRNVGLELASGEYVLFMDHDDELYPDALRDGYAFAARTGADVLNGKETRTDQAKWSLEIYDANADNVVDRQDIHPLIPTNPHKLFRRELLMQHGIRFPEGRRVLWEDVFFALDVARHAKVISVLAETPFYHWVRGQETASSSYTKDRGEYWRWVREIVIQTNEKLGGDPALAGQWRLMMLHQYRSRVLSQLGLSLLKAPRKEFDMVRGVVDELLNVHIPEELDAALTPTQLGRAVLVRAGRWDLLAKLVSVDSELVGIARTTAVGWDGDQLRISTESRWTSKGGVPLALRYDGDRVVRNLPPEVTAALPDGAVDMTGAIAAAHASVGVRSRATAITWLLPGTCDQRIDDVVGRPELVVSARAVLDPASAGFGHFMEDPSWDLSVRNSFLGAINQRGLRTDTPARTAVRKGRVYIAYRSLSGMLAVDIDETNRSLAGSAKLDPKRAVVTPVPTSAPAAPRWRLGRRPAPTFGARFEVPLSSVQSHDDTVLSGRTQVGTAAPRPARIVGREDGLWLESEVEQRAGTHPLTLLFHGREIDSGLDLVIAERSGAVTLSRRPPKG